MKILLAVDGTKHSEAATEKVINLDFPPNSEIKIISIVSYSAPFALDPLGGMTDSLVEYDKASAKQAKIVCEDAARRIKNARPDKLTVSTEVLRGTPESRIVEIAEEWGADMIVVGSHGYNTWERLLLGSVSNSIVHHAPCSVLIVRNTNRCTVAFPKHTKVAV